ncbi:hypothetical protein ACFL1M_01445 [Patescibacteria group bacterium]
MDYVYIDGSWFWNSNVLEFRLRRRKH